jgi:hypothetical protein
MPAIQFTDPGATTPVSEQSRVLARAAVAALGAPSILNTQPWRWRIGGDVAELRADRDRQVQSIDPDGRLPPSAAASRCIMRTPRWPPSAPPSR